MQRHGDRERGAWSDLDVRTFGPEAVLSARMRLDGVGDDLCQVGAGPAFSREDVMGLARLISRELNASRASSMVEAWPSVWDAIDWMTASVFLTR